MNGYNRRDFLKSSATAAAAAAIAPGLVQGASAAGRKPNVVIMLIDDLGYAGVGCFGNKRVPTPNIDSMAANGARCTMSYVTNPPCSPSRCCMLTGMYTQRFGKSGMARGLPIPDDHPTLAEFMRDSGYVTGQIGKWDVGSKEQGPAQRGFTEVAKRPLAKHYECTRDDGSTAYLTDVDGDYMAEFVDRNKDKQFFLYFSPLAIHAPVEQTPQRYRDRIPGGDGTAYEGAIAALDDAVGKLLTALKKHGLEKDTLILFTGDNGPNISNGGSSAPYRGGKLDRNTIYEGWVHTPTIVSWPGTVPGGITYDGMMCTLDFYATAAAAAGKPLPKRCEGKDLVPFLKGEKKGDVHEYLFWHNADPTDDKHRNLSAVRWKDWRLVKYPDGWKLFDLKKDPQETVDLAKDNAETAAGMKKHHDEFVAALPPIKPGADYNRIGGSTESGWGWVIGDGKSANK